MRHVSFVAPDTLNYSGTSVRFFAGRAEVGWVLEFKVSLFVGCRESGRSFIGAKQRSHLSRGFLNSAKALYLVRRERKLRGRRKSRLVERQKKFARRIRLCCPKSGGGGGGRGGGVVSHPPWKVMQRTTVAKSSPTNSLLRLSSYKKNHKMKKSL